MLVLKSRSVSISLSVFVSVCLCICLSTFLPALLSVCMSVCVSVSLSICLCICLSVHPLACLSVCAGWQAPVWLHLRDRCSGVPGHVHSAQPHEYDRCRCELHRQRPWLLPPSHGPPVLTCSTHLSQVSTHLSQVSTHLSQVSTRLSQVSTHLSLLLPLNGQHHYVDDSVVRRLSRAGNWWVRDRDHHSLSPQQVTHLPPVWDLLLPLA